MTFNPGRILITSGVLLGALTGAAAFGTRRLVPRLLSRIDSTSSGSA